jgi:hypothetical protein
VQGYAATFVIALDTPPTPEPQSFWHRVSAGIDCPNKSPPLLCATQDLGVGLAYNCVNFKFNYTAELLRRFRSRQVDVELDGQGCKTLGRNRAGMPPVRGYRRGVAAGGNCPAPVPSNPGAQGGVH